RIEGRNGAVGLVADLLDSRRLETLRDEQALGDPDELSAGLTTLAFPQRWPLDRLTAHPRLTSRRDHPRSGPRTRGQVTAARRECPRGTQPPQYTRVVVASEGRPGRRAAPEHSQVHAGGLHDERSPAPRLRDATPAHGSRRTHTAWRPTGRSVA